jgi:hypothetical protein
MSKSNEGCVEFIFLSAFWRQSASLPRRFVKKMACSVFLVFWAFCMGHNFEHRPCRAANSNYYEFEALPGTNLGHLPWKFAGNSFFSGFGAISVDKNRIFRGIAQGLKLDILSVLGFRWAISCLRLWPQTRNLLGLGLDCCASCRFPGSPTFAKTCASAPSKCLQWRKNDEGKTTKLMSSLFRFSEMSKNIISSLFWNI